MPSKTTRTKRNTRMRSERCSSMTSAFAKHKINAASSPIENDNISSTCVQSPIGNEEKQQALETMQDYELEFNRRKDQLKRYFQSTMMEFNTLFFNINMSIPKELESVTLSSKTYTKSKIKDLAVEVDSDVNDSLLPPRTLVGDGNPVFKRPLGRGAKKKTSKPAPTTNSNKFKTPDISMQPKPNYSALTITPKMNPNIPMSVIRRPKQGEVAVSMTGSPLLVSAVMHDELPTVTIPFADGRIFSIMPNPGQAPDDFPDFDERTKDYLKNLQDHLARFVGKNNM